VLRQVRASQRNLALAGAIIAAASLLALAIGSAATASNDDRGLYSAAELAAIFAHSPLGPLPADPTDKLAQSRGAAALGQFLFFDAHFSANGRVSCASCHIPARAFTDGRHVAKGIALGTRNTPSVINAAFNHWYFWDGRVDSEWSQALQPFENPREFGSDRLFILHVVYDDKRLREAYAALFGPPPPLGDEKRFPAHARPDRNPGSSLAKAWAAMAPSDQTAANRMFGNLGKAIEAYERKLLAGDTPFDRYVKALKAGDAAAEAGMPAAVKRGLKLFVGKAHCDLCHSGPLFSDGQFHNIGLPVLSGEPPDRGRADGIAAVKADIFNGAGPFSDDPEGAAKDKLEFLPPPKSELGAFKTPSLRNAALTAPYMHDGRFATLGQVIRFYAEGKAASTGRLVGAREGTLALIPNLSRNEKKDLVAFLRELDGSSLPPALTRAPARP
jgi:cytochrome c peroxidase